MTTSFFTRLSCILGKFWIFGQRNLLFHLGHTTPTTYLIGLGRRPEDLSRKVLGEEQCGSPGLKTNGRACLFNFLFRFCHVIDYCSVVNSYIKSYLIPWTKVTPVVPAFKQNTITGYAQKASLFLQRYLQKENGAHLAIICGEEKPSPFPMLFKQFYNCDIHDSSLPPVLFVFFHKSKRTKATDGVRYGKRRYSSIKTLQKGFSRLSTLFSSSLRFLCIFHTFPL